ncbi:MAG: hypothetical protein EA388_00015, partial [Nitriliruptor sp.]
STGTLIDHLRELWDLADEASALFAAGGGLGLTALDETRLETAAATATEGLRHTALLAGRDRAAERWLPTALGFGDLAVGLIQAAAHAGRPPGPVPDRPDLPAQIGQLEVLSRRAAPALLALACARAAIATGGNPRFSTTAAELQATSRLQPEPGDGPLRSWTAQLVHTTDQFLGHAGDVPAPVAASLAPRRDVLAVADPHPRARRYSLSDRIPGLAPSDLLATRGSGSWEVPGSQDPHRDRIIFHLDPALIGPLRAAALDRDATISTPDEAHGRR